MSTIKKLLNLFKIKKIKMFPYYEYCRLRFNLSNNKNLSLKNK